MITTFYPFLNKCHYRHRWTLLSFCVWIVMGAFYCFDVPAALHNSMAAYFDMKDEHFEIYFSGLYAFYSFANIFLPFISGRMRDKIGDRIVMISMVTAVFIGQCIFAYGIHIKSFPVMYVGRILSGWGIESVQPTQTQFISPYFKDDYLGFAVGMNSLFATFGSISTMYYCPYLAAQYGLMYAVLSGAAVNLFSMACTLISIGFDKNAEIVTVSQIRYEEVKYLAIQQQDYIIHDNQYPDNRISRKSQENEEVPIAQIINSVQGSDENLDLQQFPTIFWLVSVYFALIYSSVLGFSNVSVGLLSERWFGQTDDAEQRSGLLVAVMWLITGCFTPLFGSFVDEYGQRSTLCIIGAILSITSPIMLWYVYPFLAMILLGTSLSLAYASAWTGIVYLVRSDNLGKAYATVVSSYNLLFTFIPLLIGFLRAYYGSYYYCLIVLSGLGCVALVISIYIYKYDKALENILDGRGDYVNSASSLEKRFPAA